MLKNILFVVCALAVARAQVPSLGWCPDYVPMANFDMNRFLGVWFEAERYFQITEVVSRCVTANYTRGPDGKLRVSNEVTNRFTGIKRVLEGEIKPTATKADEGKLHVKYTVPFTPETKYAVLDTDYRSYAVLCSCSGIGPINTQNAWLMTRNRQAPGEVLQKAYGILDKYKISKTFFVKSDQDDCVYLETKPKPVKPEESKPEETPEEPEVEAADGEAEVAQQAKNVLFRSAIVPDAPAIIIETRKAEIAEAAEKSAAAAAAATALAASAVASESEVPVQPEILPKTVAEVTVNAEIQKDEPVEAAKEKAAELIPLEKSVKTEIPTPVSVPEVILKTADRVKESAKETTPEQKPFRPLALIQEAFVEPFSNIQNAIAKPVEQIQNAFAKPVSQLQSVFKNPAAQLQATFGKPIATLQQTIQQTFTRPAAVVPPAVVAEKPAEQSQEAVQEPTMVEETPAEPIVLTNTQPKAIKEVETVAVKEEKKEEEKKIES